MNRFFTLLLAAFCLTAVGQTEYPYPYNPDGNNDGYISLNDLLDLLSVYGSEFNAGVLATDSISAIFYTGEMDYWDCVSSCVGLKGNWKVLDHHLIGSYREVLGETEDPARWIDHTQFPPEDPYSIPALISAGNSFYVAQNTYAAAASLRCFCQTRTRADIEDINICEGLEDECGVCNGEGAIYECGCSDIPEGDCDCEGNQVDAIGVCGGDCLEDADGDGVCDPVLGPCEGQDYVTYHGYDYDIVETADGRCWFAENLKTLHYSDSSTISMISSPEELTQYLVSNGLNRFLCCDLPRAIDLYNWTDPFGPSGSPNTPTVIYNFKAIYGNQLCPLGWHVPTETEANSLLGSYGNDALTQMIALTSEPNGVIPNVEYNQSGFSLGIPFGIRDDGQILPEDQVWTSSKTSFSNDLNTEYGRSWYQRLNFLDVSASFGSPRINKFFECRCIKD